MLRAILTFFGFLIIDYMLFYRMKLSIASLQVNDRDRVELMDRVRYEQIVIYKVGYSISGSCAVAASDLDFANREIVGFFLAMLVVVSSVHSWFFIGRPRN